MLRENRSRLDFLEKFQQMIAEYNAGSQNIEAFFDKLVTFAQSLSEEDQRGMAERLTAEELAIFDILTKPEPALSPSEREAVKKVARTLLETLKREKLVLDWREKQQARAAVRKTITRTFSQALPASYTPELRAVKSDLAYWPYLRQLCRWTAQSLCPGRLVVKFGRFDVKSLCFVPSIWR